MTEPLDSASAQETAMLRARVEAAEAQARFAEQLLQKLEKQLETAEAQVHQMQLRLQAVKVRHARLKASLSWKATKPLRSVYRLLRTISAALARGVGDGPSAGRQKTRQKDQGAPMNPETLVVYEDLMSAIKNRRK
jgi:chromosome segregation ATPase